jgi:hypothetical protein
MHLARVGLRRGELPLSPKATFPDHIIDAKLALR